MQTFEVCWKRTFNTSTLDYGSQPVADFCSDVIVTDDERHVPEHVRSDNRPEFVAKAAPGWIGSVSAQTAYVARQPSGKRLHGVVQHPAPRRTSRRRPSTCSWRRRSSSKAFGGTSRRCALVVCSATSRWRRRPSCPSSPRERLSIQSATPSASAPQLWHAP